MRTSQYRVQTSILAVAACLMVPAAAQAQTTPAPAQPAPAQPAAQGTQQKPGAIVVTGTRSDVIASPDRVSFNVANDLQAQTGSVADALRSVPGVEVDLQGNVSLRGDSGVKIMINGRPSAMLEGQSRGDVLLGMPAGQIERVEVITNPSAAMSPEGSGGVLNLIMKQARKDTRTATVRGNVGGEGRFGLNVNGAQSSGDLTLTGDAGFRRFTGEGEGEQLRSRLDPATGTFLTSRLDNAFENGNKFGHGRFGIEYDLDQTNRLSSEVSYRQGGGEVEQTSNFVSQDTTFSYDRLAENEFSHRHLGAKASWRRTLPGTEHEFVADLDYQKNGFDRDVEAVTSFGSALPGFEVIGNGQDGDGYGVKLDYKRPVGEENSLNFGYQGNWDKNEFDAFGNRGGSLDAMLPVPGLTNKFDYDQTIHALYGTYRFSVGKLSTQAGLRLEQAGIGIDQITDDVQVENDYFRAYPTLHLGYELTPNDQLRGSYSRRIQRPFAQDLNPYTFYIDPQNLRRGNPFLEPEVTDSFEFAWQHRKAGAFYSMTGFYRKSDGGVTDILSDLGNGVFLTSRANLATAKRIGTELIANGKLSKTLSYNASGTVMWNEIDPLLGGISNPRSGTTATGRANVSWQPTANDFFQLNGFYSGKQLLAQGYRLGGGMLNFGYRRKINERLSLLATAQNVLDSMRFVTVFDTPTIRDRFEQKGMGRMGMLGISYNFGEQGNRKRPEPAFDFQQGGGDIPQ